MRLIISSDSARLGVANAVAASVHGLLASVQFGDHLAEDVHRVEDLLAQPALTPEQSLNIKEAKEIFGLLGYPDQIPAGSRLIESFRRSGFKRLGNVVDAYNLVSAETGLGVGLHADPSGIDEIRVERSSGDRRIIPLSQTKSRPIPAGDLIYSSRSGVMAWLGRKDIDSDEHRLTEESDVAIIVVLGHQQRSREDNVEVCSKIHLLIRKQRPLARLSIWQTILEQ